MIKFIMILLAIAVLHFLFKRYVPVLGVHQLGKGQSRLSEEDTLVLDVRDYNTSCKGTLDIAMCLPLAYLNRHYKDIPNKDLVLVVSDPIEKNLASRFLKAKGYKVVGYYLSKELTDQYCFNF